MSFDELTPEERNAAREKSIQGWMAREKRDKQEFADKLAALSDDELFEKATRQYQMIELEGWSRTAFYSAELNKRGMEHPPRVVVTDEMLDNF